MSNLLKWRHHSPASLDVVPFFGLHRDINKALKEFSDLFDLQPGAMANFENLKLHPAMDLIEDKDHYKLEVEMPGMDQDDIKISIDAAQHLLTIAGEKTASKKNKEKNFISKEISYGRYERTVSLPANAKLDKIEANFKKGMLWVVIPKRSEQDQNHRQVPVKKAE